MVTPYGIDLIESPLVPTTKVEVHSPGMVAQQCGNVLFRLFSPPPPPRVVTVPNDVVYLIGGRTLLASPGVMQQLSRALQEMSSDANQVLIEPSRTFLSFPFSSFDRGPF